MQKRIAVTGGIGSGKSSVLKMLAKFGETTFSCDEIYRELSNEKFYVEKITQAFPDCVQEGKIDKKALSALVFSNPAQRERLNQISHPLIMQRLQEKMDNCANARVFAEVPLLFEGSYENQFDCVLVILRDRQKRIADLRSRDKSTEEEIKARMRSQFSYEIQALENRLQNIPHVYLKNEGDLQSLEQELLLAMKQLT